MSSHYYGVFDEGVYIPQKEIQLSLPSGSWQLNNLELLHKNKKVASLTEQSPGHYLGIDRKGRQVFFIPVDYVGSRLKYIVSSHPHNIDLAYKQVERLLELGVTKERICVVLGKSHREDLKDNNWDSERGHGVLCLSSCIAAWEYSSLQAVAENKLEGYWFLLQDTMELGEDFVVKAEMANIAGKPDMVVVGRRKEFDCKIGTWHSLGVYHSDFLKIKYNLILSLDGINREEGIAVEKNYQGKGIVSWADKVYTYLKSNEVIEYGPVTYYGKEKLYRYFHFLDLKKYFTKGDVDNVPLDLN